MIVLARARAALGIGPKTGLRHEPRRATDRVWLAGEDGHTSIARASQVRTAAAASLEGHCPPIADQFGSSCVGEMCHGLIAIVESVYGLPYDPPAPLAAYYQSVLTHTVPGTEPVDGGTYIRSALSEIRRNGVATLAEWPRDRSHLMRPVPAMKRAHGFNRRGLVYEFIVPRTIEEEMGATDAAIAMQRPVGFGWSVTDRYMRHRGSAPYDARLRKSDLVRGGHAQVQISARDSSGVIRFRNSWGRGWGDGGNVNVIAETVTRRDLVLVSGWERVVSNA